MSTELQFLCDKAAERKGYYDEFEDAILRSSETILSAYRIFNKESHQDIPEVRVKLLRLIMYLTKIAIQLDYRYDALAALAAMEKWKKEKT